MATGLLSSIHLHTHHSDTHSHRTSSCSSSVHGHVLHAVPHSCKQLFRTVCRSTDGISGASAQHQQPCVSSPLACAGHSSVHHAQQQQQHRGSPTGAAAGGNWAVAACSAPSTPSALGWNAAFFSKYRLVEKMGAGSFGTVHKAVNMLTGNSYAVKVLQKSCSKRGMQLDAIQREVETWQEAQNSKYVAKLEGLFEVGGLRGVVYGRRASC